MKQKALEFGKKMHWNRIGLLYKKMIDTLGMPTENTIEKGSGTPALLPKFSLDHIKRLTDTTGILEHANYSVPDYKEGYCLDDNARALMLVLTAYELGTDEKAIILADTYLRYIKLMQKEDGGFHNDMSFDKKFLDETGSEDSFGRTIWAIGDLIRMAPNDCHFQFAKDLFFRSMPHFEKVQSIRAIASIIIGLCNFLRRYPDNESIMHILNDLTLKLTRQYQDEAEGDWRWFEPVLCYDSAILPLALWHAYSATRNKEIYAVAAESTAFIDRATSKNGHMSLVGNAWYYKGHSMPAQGQQPIDAMAMVMMYQKAFIVTKDETYRQKMRTAFSWFTGNNDLYIPLYDEESKGCCDGLEERCVNRNQGAESTISFLMAYLTVQATETQAGSLQRVFSPQKLTAGNVIPLMNQSIAQAK